MVNVHTKYKLLSQRTTVTVGNRYTLCSEIKPYLILLRLDIYLITEYSYE